MLYCALEGTLDKTGRTVLPSLCKQQVSTYFVPQNALVMGTRE